MGTIKVSIVYFFLIYVFFDVSYEENFHEESTKFKSGISNISFNSNLVEKLEKNSTAKYNTKKKKNFKMSISSNPNKYNKKIVKLKTKDKKLPYLYKSYVIQKNYIRTEPSHIMYMGKNYSYLTSKCISNKVKQNKLGNSAYSFIVKSTTNSIDAQILSDYNTLIKKIDENYGNVKEIYASAHAYKEMERYFKENSRSNSLSNYDNFKIEIPLIKEIEENAQECISYCEKSKDVIIKKKNELELAKDEEESQFTQKFNEFTSKIEEITKKLDEDITNIKKKNSQVYDKLKNLLENEYCNYEDCGEASSHYESAIMEYSSKVEGIIMGYNYIFDEMYKFIHHNSYLLAIKNKDFYKKEYKISLNILIEEMNDILKIYEGNNILLNSSVESIRNMECIISFYSLIKSYFVETITKSSIDYCKITIIEKWNETLKSNFEKKKEEFFVLYNKIKGELEQKIDSLVYPQEVETKSENIISDSRIILDNSNRSIFETCELLEDLSYSYSNPEIFAIQNELINLCSKAVTKNISLNSIFRLVDEKYNSMKYDKSQIDKLKANLPINSNKKLTMITCEAVTETENIERIVTSANRELQVLQKKYEDITSSYREIEKLIIEIQEKKKRQSELEKEENEQIKQVSLNIKGQLEQIEEIIIKLKQFMDLKDNENKDISITERIIDVSSFKNKDEYIVEKEKVKEQMRLALSSLFDDKKIENACTETPRYVSAKKKINYEIYDLKTVQIVLEELKNKYSEVEKILNDSTTIMNDAVTPAINSITELRNRIVKDSFRDLHKNMNTSYENFNNTMRCINDSMDDYKKIKEKFKTYEGDIEKRKCEFLDSFIEEDNESLKGKDTYNDVLNLKENINENRRVISEKISEGRAMICTFQKQFELYNGVEQYKIFLQDNEIFTELNSLKTSIHNLNADEKINTFQDTYDSLTRSIDDSVERVEQSKKIIEDAKILNKVINGCNKSDQSIEDLKGNLKELEKKISKHMDSINKKDLLKDYAKEKGFLSLPKKQQKRDNVIESLLSDLNKEKDKINNQIEKFDKLKENSNNLQKSSKDVKETIGTSKQIVKSPSEEVSSKSKNLEYITSSLRNLIIENDTLHSEVDNLIDSQNNEIADLIYNLIIQLNRKMNEKAQQSLDIIEFTKKKLENMNCEKDIMSIFNEINKKVLEALSKTFDTFKNYIGANEQKCNEIKNEFKTIVDESETLNKITENPFDKRKKMKNNYESMKKKYKDFCKMEMNIKISVVLANKKRLEYRKTLVRDAIDKINHEKTRGEEEIITIDQYKNRIDQLKSNIPYTPECVLHNFNYEDYVINSKESQKKINELQRDAVKLEETDNEIKGEVHLIRSKIREILNEVKKEKSNIDSASKAIKNMEELLMVTKLRIVKEYIKVNLQNAREEEKYTELKFTESEKIKEKVLENFKNAEKLFDSLIHNSDEKSIDGNIKNIKSLKSEIKSNIENVNEFLKEVENHQKECSLYFKNTERGKEKIEYLKKNDEDEKKEVSESVIDEINKYVLESKNCSDKAVRNAQKTRENYELSVEYEKRMDELSKDSLILAEKIKVEMKKSEAADVLIEIQDKSDNNIYLIERIKEKLTILQKEDSHTEYEDEANNEKSMIAFTKIEIIRSNASIDILNVEKIKNRTRDIIHSANLKMESFYSIPEIHSKDKENELKIEKVKLQTITKILRKLENEKDNLKFELNKIKGIETKVNDMRNEMNKYKKQYEVGIMEEIKKITDEEKKNIELLKESIKLTIDTTVTFLENSMLGKDYIIKKYEDPERKMNNIYDSFNILYKKIEGVLTISECSNTYNDLKNKREKAKIEKENIKERNKEMKNLLNNIKVIKINEVLRLILFLKSQLDNVNENADDEYLELMTRAQFIENNVQNIIYSKCMNTALNELDNAKIESSEFNKKKIAYSSYKRTAYSIYEEILKALKFIDMDIEKISSLQGYEDIQDAEGICLAMEEKSFDIDNREKENKQNIIHMEDVYEQIKIRDKKKKKIKDLRDEVDKLLYSVQDLLEKYKEIKEIKFYNQEYEEILKYSKECGKFKELINSYEEQYNKIEIELKTNLITTELNMYNNSFNDLDAIIETPNIEEFTTKMLGKVKNDINTIEIKVVDINNRILGLNASYYELLELRRKCKLYLLSLIITTINTIISKDVMIIKEKRRYMLECVQYVTNSYNSINSDIYTTNKCFSENFKIMYYLNNTGNSKRVIGEFKVEEENVLKKIDDLKNAFLGVDEMKNSIYIDESLQEIKYLFEVFKVKKKQLKDIIKKMNKIELKEMENSAKKFLDIAESYENVIENEKEEILYIKNKLKEIEFFIIKMKQELYYIQHMYSKEKMIKIKEVYEDIMNKLKKVHELEKDNNNESNQLANHTSQISHLIERAKHLLKDTEMHENGREYDLSEERNMEIVNEVNVYMKNAKSWLKESLRILETIRINIDPNKDYIQENDNTIISIYNIIKNIEEVFKKEIFEIGETNQIKSQINKVNEINDKITFVDDNNDNNYQFFHIMKQNEQSNDVGEYKISNLSIKLISGILFIFLIFLIIIISILFKNKDTYTDNKSNRNKVYQMDTGSDNSCNFNNKEVI
ncbi:reticulocyte binding protein, putative [Plasmodium relictum]|uniref:Reticulocyte binding protein, putative n=1 Tax=Plasmodium relictum TaxID=85471 RepID=A0A1J1GK09_PLARL|nr:reticulocyte binding protein, putative [Plasmodium relictum]CRG84266.1 reticulocyte binding protein, putative [Plasmodium relictum]